MGDINYHFKMEKLIFKLFYSKFVFILSFIILFIFLIGCSNIVIDNSNDIPIEMSRNPEVYFCPKNDCGKVYEIYINQSNFSVHCAFYDIDLKNIIRSLAKKSKFIDVKLVIDGSNYNEQIKGDGIKLDNNKQLMHNKFCIIDSYIVITGSFNPTYNDNYQNRNNVIVVYSNILAKNYEYEFDELWNGKFGIGDEVKTPKIYINKIKTENYFCPEDRCAPKLISLIKNAEKSIYFMSFSFTSEEIADALIMKYGLDIRGIFDSQHASNKFSQFKRLQEFGIRVKKDKNKYKMHHKVFIIDNQTVATGSFNPTLSADIKNDENLLIIHDKKIANAYLKEFDSLWN